MMWQGTGGRIILIDAQTGKETDITEAIDPIEYYWPGGTTPLVFKRTKFRLKCKMRQTRRQRLLFCKTFGLSSGRRKQRRAHRKRMRRR